MSMRSWCFDSIYDDVEQTYDREYGSADVREVIKHIIGDGIYRDGNPGDANAGMYGYYSLIPAPSGGLNVEVHSGACFINGALGVLDENETIQVSASNNKIVARFSLATRDISIQAVSSLQDSETTKDLLLGVATVSGGAVTTIGLSGRQYVTGLYDEARELWLAVNQNAGDIETLESSTMKKAGNNATTGSITSTKPNFGFIHNYNNKSMQFGIGASGTWRGIYDGGNGKWIFYEGDNDAACVNSAGDTIDLQINGTSKVKAGTNHFSPTTDNSIYLGYSGHRWKEIHAASSTIVTSDREQKKDIEEIPAEYEKMFEALKPVRYKFNDGDSGRYHTGFIAQEVEEAVSGADLDTKDFAGFVKEENSCGLRYEEFIALNTLMIQKQAKKIEELESRIRDLEGGE